MLRSVLASLAVLVVVDASCGSRNPERELFQKMNQAIAGKDVPRHDTKLLTTGANPPIALNPPVLTRIRIGEYAKLLKMVDGKLYTLDSAVGSFASVNGHSTGGYTILGFDQYLRPISNLVLNMSSVSVCSAPDFTGQCIVSDFDLDSEGNVWLGIKVVAINTGTAITVLSKMNSRGSNILNIVKPCLEEDDPSGAHFGYLTTTCADEVIIACPKIDENMPLTFRGFTSDGAPYMLTELRNYTDVTSVQQFDDQLWFNTISAQAVGLTLDHWDQVFRCDLPYESNQIPIAYSQIFVDFAGNVIVGQTHNIDLGQNDSKFTILVGDDTARTIVQGMIPALDDCAFTAAYAGRLFLLCFDKNDASLKYIMAYDYLK